VKFDIEEMTEQELIDLNHRIIARLRFLKQTRAHEAMLEFRIGDRVTFQPDGAAPLKGIITRYNRKTVTIITEGGERWNVGPTLLRKVPSEKVNPSQNLRIVPLKQEKRK